MNRCTYKDLLKHNRILDETNVLEFIKDIINEMTSNKRILEGVLYYTKSSEIGIASANAITILNYCGYSFKGKQLMRIKAAKANLRNGMFNATNSSGSDFRGANLSP